MPPLRVRVLAGVIALLALTGCSATAAPSDTAAPPSAEPTSSAPEAAPAVAECDGILFEVGGEIAGEDLAACMSAAMLAAGSGAHRVENSTGVTDVEFAWTPEFSMSAQGELAFVIRGEDGWVDVGNGWVRGDMSSSDPEIMMAGTLVETVRQVGDPRVMTALLAQTPWTIVESGTVPATDAVADTAWLLQPTGSISLMGVAVSDPQLWFGTDYLGVYFVATASVMGVTETTSNTFLQWGEPVEIPNPEA